MWIWVFNPRFGLINTVLGFVGIQGPNWLGDPQWVLSSLILMSCWGAGGGMVILLGGLQGIPEELYEAAMIDGANAWHKFWHITIPMISPLIFFNLIMGVIGSFQYFTQAFIMTQGGPGRASLFYNLYLYQNAFTYFKMGYASAMAWVMFVIILVLTLLVIKSSPIWVYYEGTVKGGK
jgi:multiple sugar transport system permease protein